MLKESISKILSDQVNAEYFSAYLYLAMSADCDRKGFKGFANWFFVQAQEEMAHGTHIYQYILERGEAPVFAAIDRPESSWSNMTAVFERALSHEQYVTDRINKIATLAMQEGDHATYVFMQWYINEQVEEEASADEILQKLKFIGDNASLLLPMDSEMATRTFVDPFAAGTGA